jgi:hypothetical protein
MSLENIVGNEPTLDGGCVLAFATKHGGVLYYKFDADDAKAIDAGSDPRWLDGERTSGYAHLSPQTMLRIANAAADFAQATAEAAAEAAAPVSGAAITMMPI